MTAIEKIFRATAEEGFCSPVFSGGSSAEIVERVVGGNPFDPWIPPQLTWERHSSRDAFPDCSVFPVLNTCSTSAAQRLWPQTSQNLKLLPFFVDGDAWNFICPLRNVEAIHADSSDIDWAEYVDEQERPVKWVSRVRWVNVLDPQIRSVDVFKLTIQPRGWGYFTERFVERYFALGLKGVRFEHLGYIVDKPEDAVPPPLRPLPQVEKAPRWPKWEGAPDEEVAHFTHAGEAFLQARNLSESAEASAILNALAAEIEAHHPDFTKLKRKASKPLLEGMAGAFGLLLHRHFHWSWVYLQVTSRSWELGLRSPNGSHALCLNQVMLRQLTSPQPSTIELLFNMIAGGNLPEGKAGDHVAIG